MAYYGQAIYTIIIEEALIAQWAKIGASKLSLFMRMKASPTPASDVAINVPSITSASLLGAASDWMFVADRRCHSPNSIDETTMLLQTEKYL